MSSVAYENAAIATPRVSFIYDQLGRVTQTTVAGAAATAAWDDLGRPQTVTNLLGTTTFGYDGDLGRALNVTSSTGHRTNYSYFGAAGEHRLQTIQNLGPASAALSKFDYEYDTNGMITQWTQQAGAATPAVWNYQYDAAYQLTGAVKTVAGTITKRFYYAYDAMGNRTTGQVDNTVVTGVFNNLNQLTSQLAGGKARVAGQLSEGGTIAANEAPIDVNAAGEFSDSVEVPAGTVDLRAEDWSGNVTDQLASVTISGGDQKALEYDANGKTTRIVTTPAAGGTPREMTFEWDAKDQLVAINQTGGLRSEFAYDGYGRRVSITEKLNGTVTNTKAFLWLGYSPVMKQETPYTNGSPGIETTTYYMPQGEKRTRNALYYTRDHLGSIREVTDAAGTLKARYEYDPYGRRTRTEGTLDVEFGFTGHYFHAPSGLYLAPFRAYDPAMGRWLSRDPIRESGSVSLYSYVRNLPHALSDRLGLKFSWFRDDDDPKKQTYEVDRQGLYWGASWWLGSTDGERQFYYGQDVANYMGGSKKLEEQLQFILRRKAYELQATLDPCDNRAFEIDLAAQTGGVFNIENGYLSGHAQLHGTSNFKARGRVKRCGTRFTFDLIYIWEDRIDPNSAQGDTPYMRAAWATRLGLSPASVVFSPPKDFDVDIRWSQINVVDLSNPPEFPPPQYPPIQRRGSTLK